MTIEEFMKKYYLHDSLFEDVSYDPESKEVTMKLDVALWMQEWYTDEMPETESTTFAFYNVDRFDCPPSLDWKQISILQVNAVGNTLKITAMNDITDSSFVIEIACDKVEIVSC